MKPIGNAPPLGLSAKEAKEVHEAVDRELDQFLREAIWLDPARTVAAEREIVDAVRRWAAQREEELFPNGRPDTEPVSGSNGDEIIGSASVGYRTYQFQGVAGNGANGASSPPTWPPLPSTAPRFEGDDWKVDAMLLARDAAMKRGHDIHARPGVPISERWTPREYAHPCSGSCAGAGVPSTHVVRFEYWVDGRWARGFKEDWRWLCTDCLREFLLAGSHDGGSLGTRATAWPRALAEECQCGEPVAAHTYVDRFCSKARPTEAIRTLACSRCNFESALTTEDEETAKAWHFPGGRPVCPFCRATERVKEKADVAPEDPRPRPRPICVTCGYLEPRGPLSGRAWRFGAGEARCERCWKNPGESRTAPPVGASLVVCPACSTEGVATVAHNSDPRILPAPVIDWHGARQKTASCVSCGYKGPRKPGCAVGARRWREYDSGLTLLCERCWDKYPAGYPG